MKIVLSELKSEHASKKYLSWLKDTKTSMYTEFRFQKHSLNTINSYIKNNLKSKNNFLYGIFIRHSKNKELTHVGNIKLSEISYVHKFANISYLVGEKEYLNKGVGYSAIKRILILAKKKFKLKKIYAGCYSNNIFSKKVLKKNGFFHEATLKKKFIFKKQFVDHHIFSKKLI